MSQTCTCDIIVNNSLSNLHHALMTLKEHCIRFHLRYPQAAYFTHASICYSFSLIRQPCKFGTACAVKNYTRPDVGAYTPLFVDRGNCQVVISFKGGYLADVLYPLALPLMLVSLISTAPASYRFVMAAFFVFAWRYI